MKKQFMKISTAFLLCGVVFSACKKDKTEEPNENEVITTMKLTFTPVGGGAAVSYQFNDPDGPGGAAPTIEAIRLSPSKVYTVAIELLDKTKTPAGDITAEITAEADEHRFYYEPTAGSNISVSGLNNDGNGIPLGITSTWTTGAAATGKIKVTLRHYGGTPPNKATADPVNSPKSDTDIEVEFDTNVL
jgi:hypothetical protein